MNRAEQHIKSEAGAGFYVRCLGRFRLQDADGNELHVRTRKARALLAYLALAGRPVAREKLADLLWSDRAEEQARASVRQAIFDLRHLAPDNKVLAASGPGDSELAVHVLPTDLALIGIAAEAGDERQLHALLASSESGLLTDLDGLDPEFDSWLRTERAREPSRTLQLALEAARHCFEKDGPRVAQPIVAEIQRLDPGYEDAARLALMIDHRLGDTGALHRHFELLRRHLREDYDAEPSAETAELFERLKASPGDARDPVEAPIRARDEPAHAGSERKRAPRARRFAIVVAILVAMVAAALLAWLVWDRRAQPAQSEPLLIAVLPFEALRTEDRFLAEGLWDDTRMSLSRNPGFRVLGRSTTRTMMDDRASPAAFRRRLGVDYLLEGSVRRSGEQVRISVNLSRTADGVAIWNQVFQGRMGDPMALQGAVASGIEGRLRGRLARGGGTRADQIATTPEVYALYSEARTLLRGRRSTDASRAAQLLQRAIAIDPNFAPAWASLAESAHFSSIGPIRAAEDKEEALGHVRQALELAPNLAQAHATLALIAGPGSRLSEPSLERAVTLDPGNSDAWNWLGNVRNSQYRPIDALPAYRRAVEIDPLSYPPIHNLVATLADLGRRREADAVIAGSRRAGAGPGLLVSTQVEVLTVTGDYSAAARMALDFRERSADRNRSESLFGVGEVLARLGYADEAAVVWRHPASLGAVIRSERLPPVAIDGRTVRAGDFWEESFFGSFAARAMVNLGRSSDLVARYRQTFPTSAEFVEATTENNTFEIMAPTLAVALRQSGDEAEAESLLSSASNRLERLRPRSGASRELLWRLARIKAAQGKGEAALRLMADATARGWLPDGLSMPLDCAQDPAFKSLRGDPRFEAISKRILDHIAKERAELGPVKV